MPSTGLGIALIALLLTGAACGSRSEAGEPEPEIGPVPVVRSPAELALPFDAYGPTNNQYATTRRAAWRLIRDCVQAFGGEFTLKEQAMLRDLPDFDHAHERRYGLIDEESAAARGYNIAPEDKPALGPSFNWFPSDAELLLVRGTAEQPVPKRPTDATGRSLPDDGCQGEADRILADGAPSPPNPDLTSRLGREASKQAEVDSRVRAVMKRWSECMTRAGFTYDDVWDPNDKEWSEPVSSEEIATAVADVRCKWEVNLLGVWNTVEAAYQRRMIERNAQELAVHEVHHKATLASAARIVGSA